MVCVCVLGECVDLVKNRMMFTCVVADLAVSDTVFPSTPANVVVSIKNRETTVALKAGEVHKDRTLSACCLRIAALFLQPTDLGTVTIFPTLGQLQNSKYINTVFALAAHLEGDTAIGIEAKIGSAAGVEGSVRVCEAALSRLEHSSLLYLPSFISDSSWFPELWSSVCVPHGFHCSSQLIAAGHAIDGSCPTR